MGSYNVSCGISRISLSPGMKATLFLLKAREESDILDRGAYLVSNEGPMLNYEPVAFPIHGKYDDYGRIGDIEYDENVMQLEKFYGESIEKICGRACYGDNNDDDEADEAGDGNGKQESKNKFPAPVAAMFVCREIYDEFSKSSLSEYGEKENAFNGGYNVSLFILEQLGFVKQEKELPYPERYKYQLLHPKLPTVTGWSDGSYCEFVIEGVNDRERHIYSLAHFEKMLKKHNLPILEELDQFRKMALQKMALMEHKHKYAKLKKLEDSMLASLEKAEQTDDVKERIKDIKELGMSMIPRDLRFSNDQFSPNYMMAIYPNLVTDTVFDDAYVKLKTFTFNMYVLNAIFAPTWNGVQFGAYKHIKRLTAVMNKIADKRLKERSE